MPLTQQHRRLTLPQPAVITALSLAFVLTVAASVLTSISSRRVAEADQRARRAQHALADTAQLLATVDESASAVHRHLLTGNAAERAMYERVRTRFPGEIDALQRHYIGHEAEAREFPRLREMIHAQFATYQQALALMDAGVARAGLRVLESDENRGLHDRVRQSIAALHRVELLSLADGSAIAMKRAEMIQALNVGLITLAVTLAVVVGWLVLRRVRDLEGLITICAWTRQVQWQGRWISFEEYLATRYHVRCTHGICDEAARELRGHPGPSAKYQVPSNK